MDFDVPQEQGLHFMYVLPFSANEALVESTYFSPKVHDSALYESHIQNYIKDRFGLEDNYTVVRKEGGVVPMTTKTLPNTGHSSWFRLGTPGGQVRPATGYSFLQVAEWIRNHKRLVIKACRRDAATSPSVPELARRSLGLAFISSTRRCSRGIRWSISARFPRCAYSLFEWHRQPQRHTVGDVGNASLSFRERSNAIGSHCTPTDSRVRFGLNMRRRS